MSEVSVYQGKSYKCNNVEVRDERDCTIIIAGSFASLPLALTKEQFESLKEIMKVIIGPEDMTQLEKDKICAAKTESIIRDINERAERQSPEVKQFADSLIGYLFSYRNYVGKS